jgi:3-phenylpropionate/trans-cinnamate dioxygenase ferredoxin reductase subunit
MEHVVVVGASLAGLRAAQALRRRGFDGSLTIIGEEERLPYNRPPLSKEFLAGQMSLERVELGGSDLGAAWLLGRPAVALDLERRSVVLEDGEAVRFDGLVIATGSSPRHLQACQALEGVFELRTLDDCLALREAVSVSTRRVLIVGAGFIGAEVASTCRALGLDVVVVDPLPLPLAPLGDAVGHVCAQIQLEHGVDLRLGRAVVELHGAGRVERVQLDDGTEIEADIVVVAIGVLPRVEWLADSGLTLADGVVCDRTLAAVGCERIVAAGDVARWPHELFDDQMIRVEHWTNAVEQGSAAAETLMAEPGSATPYAAVPYVWSDQFGVKIQGVGLTHLADSGVIVEGSFDERQFVVACGKDGLVIGGVAFNSPRSLGPLRKLVAERREMGESATAFDVGSAG